MFVEREIKNIYIGYEWKPDPSRTLLYCNFSGNGNDESGNGRNMTTSTNTSYAMYEKEQVIMRGSTTGQIQFPGTTMASVGTGDFTISFWLRPMVSTSYAQLIFGIWKFNESPFTGPQIFLRRPETGLTRWRIRGGDNPVYVDTGGTSIESGKWHHWVMTRISGVVYCYVDAVLLGQFNSTDACPTDSASRLYFMGRNDESNRQYASTGSMGDKLIIENIGWTAQRVSDYYNSTKHGYMLTSVPTNGLLAYYPREYSMLDYSDNMKNGSRNGCEYGTVGEKKGIRLQTSFSNSPTNYITTPALGNPTTYSFVGWLYKTNGDTSGSNDWQSFWENANADNSNSLRLRAKYAKMRLISYGDGTGTDDTIYTIPQNTWIQVGVTSDGSVMKLYINGELYYTGVGGTTKTNANTTYSVGRGYYNGSNWRGWCGWVRHFVFYDRVLSAEEIQSIYIKTA